MSLNSTPNGERVHIGIFGKRNAGKSSIINAVTSQDIAIVSDVAGTTTDPVSKAMEILPLGPVLITDTPGFDDEGELGYLRVEKSVETLRRVDIAVLVVNGIEGISCKDNDFINQMEARKLPYIICINKSDLINIEETASKYSHESYSDKLVFASAMTGVGIDVLRERIAAFNNSLDEKHIISDYVDKGDTVVLVVPIDEAAPKGRLILPQQQVIRDLLEASVTVVVTKDTELSDTLDKLNDKPKVVVTDSQAFGYVSKIVPEDVYLTSFSILMANYKGDLEWQVNGAKTLEMLKDGAKILICEGCTHKRQCGDIGSVKLPGWIEKYTGRIFAYEFTSGAEFPDNLSGYDLIIHCGGCTLNGKEMKYRISRAKEAAVPITNYGIVISYINGILERSLRLLTIQSK